MNPNVDHLVPPPPQPPQPHRSSFSCDRHPAEQFSGFCPSCLCERLTTLEQTSSNSNSNSNSSSRKTAAAIKAIFKVPGAGSTSSDQTTNTNKNKLTKQPSSSSSSFFPELRRTQSFSASKNEGFSGVFEPQRKSCDVRNRNTLWSLFSLDEEPKSSSSNKDHSVGVEATKNLGSVPSSVTGPVLESKEEDEEHDDHYDESADQEIRVSGDQIVVEENVEEIVEETPEEEEELKTMKDHIDLDSQAKKPSGRDLKEIAGSFWSAASGFSKKWQKWRDRQKLKKRNTGRSSAALPVQKPLSRRYRDTQSEIADYGFGRRSCDTDPRFSLDAARMSFDAGRMSVDASRMSLDAGRMSLDAGRMSIDDPRYSFDEPRASWDGYMIGRTFPRLPPMVSVVEDAPIAHVSRTDTQIPVEEPMNCIHEDEAIPGGSTQTREYYSDSSRRRKSLDRSSSIRKIAAAVVAEIDEMKAATNAKVSPANVDYFQGTKLLVGDRDLRDFSSNSLRDDCSETFELPFRDNASIIGSGERDGDKKSRRWSKPWKVWGFIYRRNGRNKEDDEKMYGRGNGVERSFSESWQELRREANGDAKGAFNKNVLRSNSSVSWRNSSNIGGSFSSAARKSGVEPIGGNGKKRRDEFVLERNRSARYSPNDIDNGLLRFYLTPMKRSGSVKSRPNNSHSVDRRVLRLY